MGRIVELILTNIDRRFLQSKNATIEAPCPASAGLKRDLRFAPTRPVDELRSSRSGRVAQVVSLRGMRSPCRIPLRGPAEGGIQQGELEHFHGVMTL
jgi:hypothetical protein